MCRGKKKNCPELIHDDSLCNILLILPLETHCMKKLILLILTYTAVYSLSAQVYDIPSKDLDKEFVEIYSHTDKKQNIIQRLSETNDMFFSIFNEPVKNAVVSLQRKYKLQADLAVNIIFDSVMLGFARDHIWDEYTGPREKYLPFLELYNSKLCPCIGEKIQQSPFHRLEEKETSDCVQKLIIDTSYINGSRRVLGSSTVNEVYKAAEMGLPYMYQHCAVLYNYYSFVIGHSNFNFVRDLDNSLKNMDKTIIQWYKNKSPELAKTFPGYKKYESDLKLTVDMLNNKEAFDLPEKTKNALGQVTVVKTYLGEKNKKMVLQGQVVYILKEDIAGSPVLSFRFTPAAKIKDREKYLSMIDDEGIVEPPPMDEKKIDIMIDTLRRKN